MGLRIELARFMSTQNIRYELLPHMETYDAFGQETRWRPFLMFGHERNYSSDVVNTDEKGLRLNLTIDGKLTSISELLDLNEGQNVIFGGSTAFGIGATSDQHTLSSNLTRKTQKQCINFGGRAYTGLQEWMQFQFYGLGLQNIDNFIHFTGLNDLFCAFWAKEIDEDFGPFFFSNSYKDVMDKANSEIAFGEIVQILKAKIKRRFSSSNQTDSLESLLQKYINKSDNIHIALRTIEKNLERSIKLTHAWNADHVFVLQPISQWVDKKNTSEEQRLFDYTNSIALETKACMRVALSKENYGIYAKGIRVICQRLGIKFIDLNSLFSENCIDDDWMFVDHVHLTDKGYALAASLIADELKLAR